ncbi:hypothetical protein AWZ03_001942 [Drosophila navojoa]|uniref:Uncharacterized protein n=1 Tax=Drosophila navojoa TaxID=7232 RepID=A0A484BTD4_DRONA|nr:uncharacterized protein LOC108653773 [Drosophila navojoa]TDG51482.1 hypothetical protein AWZ03_001942 [Drosophila navojoa]
MPRRYTTKLQLEKLNRTIESLKSSNRSEAGNSASDSDDEEEKEEVQDEFGNTSMDGEQQPTRTLLEHTSHHTHPAFNQGLGQNSVQDRQLNVFPSCAYTVALPVYISSQSTPIVEPCHQRPATHDEWMRNLHYYKSTYLKQTAEQKQRQKKHDNQIYNCHLFDLAEHIALQDNTYFRDSYDYYYTGGNLNLMSYSTAGCPESKPLAMHVSGERLQCLHFSQVGVEAELWRPLHSESLTDMSSEIFELLPINSFRVNHGNMFLARMLNDIVIYELKELEDVQDADEDDNEDDGEQASKYELCCQSRYTSQDGPFISVAQATNSPNTLAIACQDHTVRFKDIVTQQDIMQREVCILKGIHKTSAWAQLRASQEHCFHYLCQSALLTIDLRCSNEVINPCFASSAYSSNCESFSCLGRSVNPHLLYVASNHKLHCLDMRCMGQKVADRAVVTWTHQMSYSPTFMDAIAYEGSEYVAMSSADPSDQRVCELKGVLAQSHTEMWSHSLPYEPPQLEEALLQARLQGVSVDIYADLAERIKCCTTGIKFHRLDNAIDGAFAQLLTAKSVGDIYCQRLTLRDELEMQREQRTGVHTKEAILYYAELVRHHVKRKLRCTTIQSMSVMRDVMKSAKERDVEQEKPLVIEDVAINYGFSESEPESMSDDEGNSEEQQTQPTNSQSQQVAKKEETPPPETPPAETKPNEDQKAIKKKKAVNRGPWQKSVYYLNRFTDLISTRLLSIWDVDEFELTRDVQIDMIDEKLKKDDDGMADEDRTAAWLQQSLPPTELQKAAAAGDDEKLVPGTNLPKRFEAAYADYKELMPETFDLDELKTPKIEETSFDESLNFTRQPHSTLTASQFTVIENAPEMRPPPAKKAKTKHVMGF